MHDQELKTLAGIPLLANLGELERQRYESVCSWRSYQEDQEIIGRESDSTDVFFVVSGTVRIVNYSFSGREISYEDIDAGHLFGELAAIDGKPRSASVLAMTDSLLAAMPAPAFSPTADMNIISPSSRRTYRAAAGTPPKVGCSERR